MIKLDFSEVQGGDFEPIPEGDYLVEIEEVKEKESNSGNQMLQMKFNVVEGEYEGRKIFDNYVLTQKALWKLKNLFVALEKDVSGIAEFDPKDLEGMKFLATVTIEEYQGNENNRIKKHKKAPGVVI
jgi:hypothetical protein